MKLETKHKNMMYTNPKQFGQEENSNKTMNYLTPRMGFKPIFQKQLHWWWWTSSWILLILWLLIPLEMFLGVFGI